MRKEETEQARRDGYLWIEIGRAVDMGLAATVPQGSVTSQILTIVSLLTEPCQGWVEGSIPSPAPDFLRKSMAQNSLSSPLLWQNRGSMEAAEQVVAGARPLPAWVRPKLS
jgi:hypothetical protein